MKHIIISLFIYLACTSCINLEDMNIDPNNAKETNPGLLLTTVAYDAFAESGTGPGYAARMLVQTDGESREQLYKWNRGSFSYYDNLRNVTKMSEEGAKQNSEAYVALAHFFRAHYFYKLTLQFGDVPYSKALLAELEGNYNPSYDSQERVFAGILQELDKASTLLKSSDDIISGDIIYKGDLMKWRKLINAYRLKVLMSLSGKTTVEQLNIKTTFAQIVQNEPLMNDVTDNGQVVFLDQQDNRYPQFNSSGFGSGMYMDSTYISALVIRKDPRLFAIATQTPNAVKNALPVNDFSSYDGGDPIVPYSLVNDKAAAGDVSKPNLRYYKDPTNEPLLILGYPEQQFILAEAVVRGWITGNDKAYYESGVKASFKFFEMYAKNYNSYFTEEACAAYLTHEHVAYLPILTNNQKIEYIIMQKYLPSFLQGLWFPFFEYLRTGYPDFRKLPETATPYRWMYPQDEYNNNTQHVNAALQSQFAGSDKITDKPWWLR